MFKLISQNAQSFTYLATIEMKKFEVKVSKSGELINISPYGGDVIRSSANKRIEFG